MTTTARIGRTVLVVGAAAALGYFCILLLGLAGWSLSGRSGTDRLADAAPVLIGSALFGVAAVAVLVAGFGARRWWLVALGAVPALVQAAVLL